MPSFRRIAFCGVVIYLLGQVLFLVNIQFPTTPNFDEFHYVPSAKQFLENKPNQNWEHPPLGKQLMSFGIALWGDRPIGWRFMSTVFGALTLVGIYLLALLWFQSQETALWTAALTGVNQLLYVQSRIGMLDTFMFCFIVWALAAFTATWNEEFSLKLKRFFLALAGILFGLAIATKWFAVIAWGLCVGLVWFILNLQKLKVRFPNATHFDWYHPHLWSEIKRWEWPLYLLIIPFFIYFIPFIPLLSTGTTQIPVHGLFSLFDMQREMWEGQLRVVSSHPYMSQWWHWVTLIRPIWYAFDKDPGNPEFVRGVLLLGNPLIMWGGLLALLACLYAGWVNRGRDAFFILYFYFGFIGCWWVIPRKISFYYYYYPSGMMLSFAIAYIFHYGEQGILSKFKWPRMLFLAVATALFIYFFPILSGMRIPSHSFRDWMWLNSWI